MEEQKATYRAQELEGREPAYHAVIPADVRYDTRLKASAKLLYGELTALCDRTGYCWASNKYFAQLYGTSDRTVERLLQELEDCGYIIREVLRDNKNNVTQRRIYAGAFLVIPSRQNCREGSRQNCQEGSRQKCREAPDKNVGSLNSLTIHKNDTPIIPTIMKRFTEYSGNDSELLQRLVDFAEMRHKQRCPIKTDRQVTLLLNKLDTLSKGDAAMKRTMLDEAVEKGWKSVYAPKPDYAPQRTTQAPRQIRREDMPL